MPVKIFELKTLSPISHGKNKGLITYMTFNFVKDSHAGILPEILFKFSLLYGVSTIKPTKMAAHIDVN